MRSYICRPLRENVPDQPSGALLTRCGYCGRECWALAAEAKLPASMAALPRACTACALRLAATGEVS